MTLRLLRVTLLLATSVTLLPAVAASVPSPANAPPAPTIALVGATLIDGTGSTPVSNSVVLVRGDRIIDAGKLGSVSIPRDAKTIDVAGRWIIPGMVDSHVHFHETGRIYTAPGAIDLTKTVSYDDEIAWMKRRLPVTLSGYLCAGVTSAISVGGPRFEYEVREAASRLDKSPNVYIGHGPIIAVKLGHEVFPAIDGDEATRFVSTEASARAEVDRGIAWHADLIKAGYLGSAFTNRLRAGHSGEAVQDAESHYFELLPVMVAEAHAHGLPITIHVTELDAAKKSIRAGVDSLAHTVTDREVDDEFLQLAQSHHVIIVSTVAIWGRQIEAQTGHVQLTDVESRCGDPEVIRSWSEVKDLPPVSAKATDSATTRQHNALSNVLRIHRAGIPLALGVDAANLGLLHGASVHQEIALLQQAGIPPMDIIVAATRNAARIARKENDIGTLEAGKRADLVVLQQDPLKDARNLGSIDRVMKSGRMYSEKELLP